MPFPSTLSLPSTLISSLDPEVSGPKCRTEGQDEVRHEVSLSKEEVRTGTPRVEPSVQSKPCPYAMPPFQKEFFNTP
jgi:hypothetical protein